MDKEKQIEEMAIIIEHACDDCNGTVDHCIKCPYKCTKQYGCGELKTATDLYNADYHKVVRCKDCIHRLTTNCALYCSTYTDENGTKTYFNGACHSDDFYCAYGVKKPE